MAIFWLNSNGTNDAPFDTKEKGANTIEDIRTQSVATTDTIMVARGSVTTDSAFNGATYNKVCSIIAEDDGINSETTRPVINYTIAGGGPFWGGSSVGNDINITGIKFSSTNPLAPDFYTSFAEGFKYNFTDCILERTGGGSATINNPTKFVIDRCVIINNASTIFTMLADCSIKSTTLISNSTTNTMIVTGSHGSIVDTIVYLNPLNDTIYAFGGEYFEITNCIAFSESGTLVDIANSNNTIINSKVVDPKLNLNTYRCAADSPAIGMGTLFSNIGWDQITQKVPVVVSSIKFATGSSSYFGNEFFPPYTGGVGSVPHAF